MALVRPHHDILTHTLADHQQQGYATAYTTWYGNGYVAVSSVPQRPDPEHDSTSLFSITSPLESRSLPATPRRTFAMIVA